MKKTNLIFGIIAAILAIGLVVAVVFPHFNLGEPQTISTSGSHEITADPDIATIIIGFDTLDDSAEQAQEKNAQQMEEIRNALLRAGLTEENFKTLDYWVGPEYSWRGGDRELVGYRAVHTLEVTTTDISKVGIYLDTAVEAGATGVYGVRFSLSNEHEAELKKQALSKATQDARDKADAMAAGLGTKVKGVLSISDQTVRSYPYLMELSAAEVAATGVPTEISPGDVEVSAHVQATFELA